MYIHGVSKFLSKGILISFWPFPLYIIICIAVQGKTFVPVVREKQKTFQRECIRIYCTTYPVVHSIMLATLIKKNKPCNKNFQLTWKCKMVMWMHFSNAHLWVAPQDNYQEEAGSRQVHLKSHIYEIEIAAEIVLKWERPTWVKG